MSGTKKSKRNFSCYIVGSDNLLIQCAEILLQEGHAIIGIVSRNSKIKNWAQQQQISCEEDFTSLKSTQFDYLFSIVNDKIIPNIILKVPRYFAINYHDALLPAYAGTHATSWAILNNEKKHGITWHVMNDVIDGGDILKQVAFNVNDAETTLSLNLKCYEHAVSSFKELIDELAHQTHQRKPQNLTQRTYYATHQKPINNGWISWHQPAETIDRLCRALTFGSYPNRLSTAKCILGDQAFIVTKTSVLEKYSQALPGKVIKVHQDYLQVATTNSDIRISKLLTLKGKLQSITEICQQCNITVGTQLISPTETEFQLFAETSERYSKNERFWLQQLENFKPAKLPFAPKLASNVSLNQRLQGSITLKPDIYEKVNSNLPKKFVAAEILLTLLLIYFYRIGNQEQLGVNFESFSNSNSFVTALVPFSLQLDDEIDFMTCLLKVKTVHDLLRSKEGFLSDIYQRYPTLMNYSEQNAISITIDNQIEKTALAYSSVNILINETEKKLSIFTRKDIHDNFKIIVKNMVGHLKILLDAVMENPNKKISHLPLLTAKDRQQILIDWNHTEGDFPKDKTVHQLFEEQVKKTPDSIAVVFEDQQLTYKELNERCNQLAHYLTKKGVKSETLVAVCLERGVEMIIAILGILKTGGAYVPIDPEYPETRIQCILNDCQVPFIITQKTLLQKLENISSKANRILLDKDILVIDEPVENPKSFARSNNLIYVIYTSGSTGKPKGVEILHQAVVRLVKNANYIKINENDCVAQASSTSFDAATFEIWSALLNGSRLVIIPKEILLDNEELSKVLINNQVSTLWLTFSLFRQFVYSNPEPLYSIKNLLIGGEAVTAKTVELYLKNRKNKSQKLINGYGPTETTTFATYYTIENFADSTAIIPIGKPISATQVYVLDKNQQALPLGVIGELCISGSGLARGYLNQAELTQQKFIFNPFDKQNNRLYRTGDLVRWLPNGDLDYIGRIDNQVKVRGYRIEPLEIENALITHKNIKQAIVLIKTSDEGKQLIAYFVKKNDSEELNQNELRRFLETKIPIYMFPSKLIEVKSIPLTANGKVDREELLKFNSTTSENKSHLISSGNSLEFLLLNIWEDIFKSKNISINDNFFALGGDSILAMQVVARIRQIGFKLSIKEIFAHPTIAELTVIINRENSEFRNLGDTAGNFPLTPIQHWFFQQNFLVPEQWGQVCLIEASELINPTVLEKSFFELLKHHDALRLRFKKSDGHDWQQEFDKSELFFKKIIKISAETSDEVNSLLCKWQYELLQHFSFDKGPLLGYVIFQVNTSSKILIGIHHLIVDGVSWRILLEDLRILYRQLLENKKPCLPKKTASFKDWYKALNHYVNSSFFEKHKNYWIAQQKREYEFPTDFQLGCNIENSMKEYQDSLSTRETDKLFQLISGNYQINSFLITALVKAFEVYSAKSELYINFESHGRTELNDINLSRTAGWFTSLYPLYLQWNSSSPLIETLDTIREQLAAVPNNGMDYGLLRYLAGKQTQELIDYAPISFNYWGQFDQIFPRDDKFKFNWLRLTSGLSNHRSHLLDINCWVRNSRFEISVNYSENLYNLTTVQMLVKTYLKFLQELIEKFIANKGNKLLIKNKLESNIYPLSPMQEGLLFHNLRSPTSEAYVVQLSYKFDGKLNVPIFCKSLQLLIDRHDILRTTFKWDDEDELLQLVQKNAELVWQYYEWQDCHEDGYNERLEKFLKADRQIGFDLTKAPIMRLTLIRLSHQCYQIVLTLHHILIDGWSLPILFKELNQIYLSFCQKKTPELLEAKSYKEYIKWLQHQDLTGAKIFWQNYLHGFLGATDLMITKSGYKENEEAIPDCRFQSEELSEKFTQRIEQFAKKNKLTMSAVFHSLWAILLARYNQINDVVFGVTMSGRPPELHESEQMVGIFINTLPLRIKFSEKNTALDCLRNVQSNLSEILSFHYTSLSKIEEWLGFSSGTNLFKCNVGFESYPTNPDTADIFCFKDVQINDPTHYPLTFVVVPGKNIILKINYDQNLIEENSIRQLISHLKSLLLEIIEHPYQKLLINDIHPFLQDKLPDNMISRNVSLIKNFPLTTNGKIDREASFKFDSVPIIKKVSEEIVKSEESTLIDIYEKILNISNISSYDNFFALGGHSLSALQVISQIRSHLGVRITVKSFFENPTIMDLAAVVRTAVSEKSVVNTPMDPLPNSLSALIAFRKNGVKTPLFLIHPIGGTVFWYTSLAKYLDPERPFYGIQDPGIESKIIPFQSVEEVAEAYIKIIRSVQPFGPYLIGGASGGAIVSVEIARQLQQQGEKVAFIGLLDGWVPMPHELLNQEFFEANMRRQYNSMREKFLAKNIDRAEMLLNLQWQRIQMYAKYKVPILDNRLTLFKAKEIISIYQPLDAPMNHWEHYSSKVELHLVPGDHETMFQEPHVRVLAERLNRCLNDVITRKMVQHSEFCNTQTIFSKNM